eukprot:TRINITY_DN43062_c0_g1_i2.p1 TRINITY_DN43062_c0_g1~~TRINITY_DN43062_c0_g1_i2.p1  ORF type:complete len:297 (-),score=68.09 TRINITY_DN43062_c0_g1_i2:323-1213(-)
MEVEQFSSAVSRKRSGSPSGAPEKKQQSSPAMDSGQRALLEALNTSLGTKLDRLVDSVGALATRVESVETNLRGHDNRLADLESSLRNLKIEVEQRSKPVSEASTTADNPYVLAPTSRGGKDTLILGGVPMDSAKQYIEGEARRMSADAKNLQDLYCPGRRGTFCKVEFTSSEAMWSHVKKTKGVKFKSRDDASLWWTVEKSAEERFVSKKVSTALKLLVQQFTNSGKSEEEAKKLLEADYTRGIVGIITEGDTSKRVFQKPKGEDIFKVSVGATSIPGLKLNFAEALAEISGITV